MRVQSLELRNFRNYAHQELTLSANHNLFLGNNGQGKTNLLEAVYLLSHARSNRTGAERELMKHGSDFAVASAVIRSHLTGGETKLEVQVQRNPQTDRLKTTFKLNGSPLRSRSEVLGSLPSVSFFLPDLLLVRGTPEDRRFWLDAAVMQYDKRHLVYMKEYQRIRQQKNRLLKEPLELINRAHLETWNQQLATAGAKLIESRLRYLHLIEHEAAIFYLELSDGQEHLSFQYESSLPLTGEDGLEKLETYLQEQLQARMSDEIRRATSLVGPHRDDIRFCLNGQDAGAFASQGQQRTIVLALKLTELKVLNARFNEPPVLLLDDVMAELDPKRQQLLLAHLDPQAQVLMTTTHPTDSWQTLLGSRENLAVFTVSQGAVVPESIGMIGSS